MTEVRMQDLRFSQAESRALLEKTSAFVASDDALANLQQEIEGWVVGLRLVSLALGRIEDPEGFLKGMQGGIQQTQKYLIQEVVARQSPRMRDWLLQTALLDRFCGPLCNAVRGAEPGAGASELDGDQFIEALVAGNLFAIPLDARGEWFRYHHLFQQLLQVELNKRMAPDEIARLHLRACEWLESQGLIEEAIQHAMKAKDGVGAAEIVEQHRRSS
jgi:LuxR family maltose regulon positive regulatory protein